MRECVCVCVCVAHREMTEDFSPLDEFASLRNSTLQCGDDYIYTLHINYYYYHDNDAYSIPHSTWNLLVYDILWPSPSKLSCQRCANRRLFRLRYEYGDGCNVI